MEIMMMKSLQRNKHSSIKKEKTCLFRQREMIPFIRLRSDSLCYKPGLWDLKAVSVYHTGSL